MGGARRDGRVSRAARTREAVVDALLALNDRGVLRPTARDIAAEAGVSLRSLYVHFDDLESLFVAAGQRHTERLLTQLPPLVTEGPFGERLDRFLDRRVRLHELAGGVRRAAQLQEPFSPAIQEAMANGRKALRAEVAACFAPELAAAADRGTGDGRDGRRRLLDALDIVTGAAAWDTLRIHRKRDEDEARRQVRDMVVALVSSWASLVVDDTAGSSAGGDAPGDRTPATPAASSVSTAASDAGEPTATDSSAPPP
ncbi:MAG TPA: TetR/AcrR family transcriptional regulator [Acidimicrobiales bacterium]|nr:TetR/AcrR family transcriptional regulator [Acidimicrobiales bacterium]